ncbi:MAG: class I SAM-dependent methyltransferase [Actinobacteria bacterium]|nr:MAG: class I SAM-dependent methyltransferase [Actinomycetota bacterium]
MDVELYDTIHRVEATHWWYVGRRAVVFDTLTRVLADYERPRVLDLGCGTGFNLEAARTLGVPDGVGVDLSIRALSFCRERGLRRLVRGDAAAPPFCDAMFDIVLALDVIEHVEDDRAALGELLRVLRPGGRLIVFTPAFQFLWSVQDRVSHHYRRYTATELRTKLSDAGYVVDKVSYANMLLFPVVLAGRLALRISGRDRRVSSENDLHPTGSNSVLARIFSAERPLLRRWNLPFGVSLLAVAAKPL